MESTIRNANIYSAYLEGNATTDETQIILNRIMRSSRFIMELNLASGNS